MNLLVVTNNPSRASFKQRIGVYLDILRRNDIDCEVAKLPSGSLGRRKLFKRAVNFDGVFLHKKALNFFDAFWLRRYARKVIYDFDDGIMYYDKHPDRPSHKRQKSFQRTVKLVDMVIAGNRYLAGHARKFNGNIEVLATGLDVSDYKQDVSLSGDGKIRRFDNVILRIICDDFFDLQNMEVEEHRWSLETQAVDLAQSHIGLAPLPDNRFARGKCGFKILQYSAAGLPVIASPVGTNAEYIQEGTNGFLARDCSDWIEKTSTLLKNPQLRRQMGQAGRAEVRQFDLKVLGKQLVNLIKGCVKKANT